MALGRKSRGSELREEALERITPSGEPYWLSVISARRSGNIAELEAKIGSATWYVPEDDYDDYIVAASSGNSEMKAAGSLCRSRNNALSDAFLLGLPCVQTDDDLVRIKKAYGRIITRDISFEDSIDLILARLNRAELYYGAVAPTTNSFFVGDITSRKQFCIASCSVIRPCDLRFDECLTLKEDYDYTIQHITYYGGVVRSNDLLAQYKHYTNHGGAVEYRSPAEEERNIAYLKVKWGDVIRDNPRRRHEILLRIRGSG